MNRLLLACVAACVLAGGATSSLPWPTDPLLSEAEAEAGLAAVPAGGLQERCGAVGKVMGRGWWGLAASLVTLCTDQNIKVETQVHREGKPYLQPAALWPLNPCGCLVVLRAGHPPLTLPRTPLHLTYLPP